MAERSGIPLKQFTKKDLEDPRLVAVNDYFRQIAQNINSIGDPGSAGLVWKGPWANSTTYAKNDVVSFDGSSYVSILAGKNNPPSASPSFWQLFVAKGAAGPGGSGGSSGSTGPAGPPGPPGPGATRVYNEPLTSQIDGITAVFTVAGTPAATPNEAVYYNSGRARPGIDYISFVGGVLTMAFVPSLLGGDYLYIDYDT